MQWTDITDIAIELLEAHPDTDPLTVNFVDLRNWVVALPDFDDDPERCGEKILEAIQATKARLRHLMEDCGITDGNPTTPPVITPQPPQQVSSDCEEVATEIHQKLAGLQAELRKAMIAQDRQSIEALSEQLKDWENELRHLKDQCGG